VEIAAALSMTGSFQTFGKGNLEGIQLALEEAKASGSGPQIELTIYDTTSEPERAKEIAGQVTASRAVLVLGPSFSVPSLAAGPEFARAGLASITTTATSDLITDNATTFRMLMKNSEQGELLATYLVRVFDQRRAVFVFAKLRESTKNFTHIVYASIIGLFQFIPMVPKVPSHHGINFPLNEATSQ